MKIQTLEVRIRLDSNLEESRSILQARNKLMDIPGVLSVVTIGPVDDTSKTEWLEESHSATKHVPMP